MLTEFVPVLVLFYTLAVLVQLPNTRVLRLSALVAMGNASKESFHEIQFRWI